ncbi:MAG: hypothetical protein U0354_19705 [Candidatus Sericytochromatia bacterium]
MFQVNLISHIYNPANQTPKEIIENFVIREKEFDKIFSDLRDSEMIYPEQHYLILGQRGYGKTTLLLKIHNEIKNNKDLDNKFCSVMFNEEQYNIRRLERLWEQTAEYLEEYQGFENIFNDIIKEEDKHDYEEVAFKIIEKNLKNNNKKLILLIDNINDIFDKFTKKESQRLREILLTSSEIRVIGASSKYLEYNFSYDKPFFEFFKVIELKNLNKEETIKLLLKLSDNYKENNVKDIIENKPNKIEALRRITGGVPRTIVLLFEIFADDKEGSSFKDLEILLDRVTPLYKHRMDDLSPIQQEIVDIIALNWDAVNTKYISQKTRIESKSVSSQLKELEKNNIINKINTSTKNHLYQISERFFNIWYLMRYGRKKEQDKIRWLVEFLEAWCDKEDLYNRTLKHIKMLDYGKNINEKYALYMTEALSKTKIDFETQHMLIECTREFLELKDSDLKKELSDSDIEILIKGANFLKEEEFELALKTLNKIVKKNTIKYTIKIIKDFLKDRNNYVYICNIALLFLEIDSNLSKKYLIFAKEKRSDIFKILILYFGIYNRNKITYEKFLDVLKYFDIKSLFKLDFIYLLNKNNRYFTYTEKLLELGISKNDEDAKKSLAFYYFLEKVNPLKALSLIEDLYNDIENNYAIIIVLLWNNKISTAIKLIPDYISFSLKSNEKMILLLLIF